MKRVSNPPNPWHSTHVEWLDEPPEAELEIYEEDAKSLLSENKSPDLSFRFSVNPYRGCQHACSYCYARPSHQYLGFGAGTDFERKLIVKRNAPALLRQELSRRSWQRERIVFSGNTDCYQPIEASYALTRGCLDACLEHQTPVGIITKSALVRRDIDLLRELARGPGAQVFVSIAFLDERTCRKLDPGAPTPAKRFEVLRALHEAGIPTGVSVSPLIPGLNEPDIAGILERATECGATQAFMTLLRLPSELLEVFFERIRASLPEREQKIVSALKDMRGGGLKESRFGARMSGSGPRWDAVRGLFDLQCRRLGLNPREEAKAFDKATLPARSDHPPRPSPAHQTRQGELF